MSTATAIELLNQIPPNWRERITLAPPPDDSLLDTDCWLWCGGMNGAYGKVKYRGFTYQAHRATHEMFFGYVPCDTDLDHLCFTERCCNPLHVEPVDRSTNQLRASTRRRRKAAERNAALLESPS